MDDKEYRLKISKHNIIKCIDNKCYTQKLEDLGLQFDDKEKLIHFFNILGTGNKEYYESIAISLCSLKLGKVTGGTHSVSGVNIGACNGLIYIAPLVYLKTK